MHDAHQDLVCSKLCGAALCLPSFYGSFLVWS